MMLKKTELFGINICLFIRNFSIFNEFVHVIAQTNINFAFTKELHSRFKNLNCCFGTQCGRVAV